MGLGWVELSLWSQVGVLAGVEGAGRSFGRELEPSVARECVCGACVVLQAITLLHPFLLIPRNGWFRVGGARGIPERGPWGRLLSCRAAPPWAPSPSASKNRDKKRAGGRQHGPEVGAGWVSGDRVLLRPGCV